MAPHQRAYVIREAVLFSLEQRFFFFKQDFKISLKSNSADNGVEKFAGIRITQFQHKYQGIR